MRTVLHEDEVTRVTLPRGSGTIVPARGSDAVSSGAEETAKSFTRSFCGFGGGEFRVVSDSCRGCGDLRVSTSDGVICGEWGIFAFFLADST
jgi:hypothetical protein